MADQKFWWNRTVPRASSIRPHPERVPGNSLGQRPRKKRIPRALPPCRGGGNDPFAHASAAILWLSRRDPRGTPSGCDGWTVGFPGALPQAIAFEPFRLTGALLIGARPPKFMMSQVNFPISGVRLPSPCPLPPGGGRGRASSSPHESHFFPISGDAPISDFVAWKALTWRRGRRHFA